MTQHPDAALVDALLKIATLEENEGFGHRAAMVREAVERLNPKHYASWEKLLADRDAELNRLRREHAALVNAARNCFDGDNEHVRMMARLELARVLDNLPAQAADALSSRLEEERASVGKKTAPAGAVSGIAPVREVTVADDRGFHTRSPQPLAGEANVAHSHDKTQLSSRLEGLTGEQATFRAGLERAAQYLRDCGDYGLNNIADHILTFEPPSRLEVGEEERGRAITNVLRETNMCTGCHRVCQCQRIASRIMDVLRSTDSPSLGGR